MGGSQSTSNTFVAVQNSFPHDVYAKCDSETPKLIEMDEDEEMAIGGKLNAKDESGITAEMRHKGHQKFLAKIINIGFSTVKPGKYLEFNVPVKNTETVYITLYANNENGKLFHPLCVNLPKNINAHVLVEYDGQVVQSDDTSLFKPKE
ncbi:uncharacterized protein LOC132750319 [Ruditapes philippinarum]|uniref:uncharacterized protein LOC132750319 n=1 Tax=Ruditapes philippinarum TaxID=129788 RepID=UPI00295ADC67|nr:uncharacterized protein LOC132750319 [Ruditapes philippinarum]